MKREPELKDLAQELLALESETFEIADYTDLSSDLMGSSTSSSCSSCCSTCSSCTSCCA